MTRFLGLDIGTKRIGVACSDPTNTIASPFRVLARSTRKQDYKTLLAWEKELDILGYVIGLPLQMNGKAGIMASKITSFANSLEKQSPAKIFFWDERLSTVAAERALLESGMRRKARREVRDAVAAALILQGWLDARKNLTPTK